jgi:hypothetical protein
MGKPLVNKGDPKARAKKSFAAFYPSFLAQKDEEESKII